MRYLLLIYTGAVERADRGRRGRAMIAEYRGYAGWLQEQGMLLGGEALQDVANATTVAVRDGRRIVTDGPFAETKEHLAGYYLVDAEGPRRGDRRGGPHPGRAARQGRDPADPGARLIAAMIRATPSPASSARSTAGRRDADPGARRLRPRRGGGRGRLRDRARAVAVGRDPGQPGRMDHDHRAQPGHRPAPSGAALRGEAGDAGARRRPRRAAARPRPDRRGGGRDAADPR